MPQIMSSSSRDDDDSHLLLGLHETRGNLGMVPSLSKWLGEELSREAAVSKEWRKAREERVAAAPELAVQVVVVVGHIVVVGAEVDAQENVVL